MVPKADGQDQGKSLKSSKDNSIGNKLASLQEKLEANTGVEEGLQKEMHKVSEK